MKTWTKALMALFACILFFFAVASLDWIMGVQRAEREAHLVSDRYNWVPVVTLAKPDLPNHPFPYGPYEVGFTIEEPAGYYRVFYDHNLQGEVSTGDYNWKRVEIR